MSLAQSALPAGKHRAKASASRTGAQPDGDRPCRSGWWLRKLRKRPMACPACDTLIDFRIGLGRSAQRSFLKCLHILQPIAHLVPQLEEQRTTRFGAPAFQGRLTQPPALSQFGLGHASFGLHVRPSAGFVRTAMKALFAEEAKPSGQIDKWRIAL